MRCKSYSMLHRRCMHRGMQYSTASSRRFYMSATIVSTSAVSVLTDAFDSDCQFSAIDIATATISSLCFCSSQSGLGARSRVCCGIVRCLDRCTHIRFPQRIPLLNVMATKVDEREDSDKCSRFEVEAPAENFIFETARADQVYEGAAKTILCQGSFGIVLGIETKCGGRIALKLIAFPPICKSNRERLRAEVGCSQIGCDENLSGIVLCSMCFVHENFRAIVGGGATARNLSGNSYSNSDYDDEAFWVRVIGGIQNSSVNLHFKDVLAIEMPFAATSLAEQLNAWGQQFRERKEKAFRNIQEFGSGSRRFAKGYCFSTNWESYTVTSSRLTYYCLRRNAATANMRRG